MENYADILEKQTPVLLLISSEHVEAIAEKVAVKVLAAQNITPDPFVVEQPISQSEAVVFLRKSRQSLLKLRRNGDISARILGGRVYYLRSELMACLKKEKAKKA